jgi:hypothetical protein
MNTDDKMYKRGYDDGEAQGAKAHESFVAGTQAGIDQLHKFIASLRDQLAAAEVALTPKPPREGIYLWAVDLEPTARHAQYWIEGGQKETRIGSAIMCIEQGVNSWKNACYSYAEKLFIANKRIAELEELSVTKILLKVVPDLDGNPVEIYATSVGDVGNELTKISCILEDYELGLRETPGIVAHARIAELEREQAEQQC